MTIVSIRFRIADIHFMPEYLYRNYNNDERLRGGKKHGILFTRSNSAKLRRTSGVSIDDSHWPSYTT